ncbi:CHASE domain-containing protein [Sphingomicrobium astaxanthinifaciens]|uniref:CHASE domain-containing protein n=1 Tax=Sphingomicrobium astaxanthinifaciens TaxID=1227949 RepID=UPI001FCCB431|nr:CHASE domain-containing protein [Sphingomicrobium astaxanthinifaciens]MCJ7421870.1 CHASE domain-containing protein [Sphingomicrobium astaxanthinifaciens]
MQRLAIREYGLTLLILAGGMVLAIFAALTTLADRRADATQQLERLADRATLSIENKFALQTAVLRGGVALFGASDRVTAEEFRRYVEGQELDRYNPGILGVGFAAYAPGPGEANRLARAYRAASAFRPLWPSGERADYSIITFLEPQNPRNAAALGYDMLSEANRRAAMERARAQGEAALSHKITLVQEIDEDKQAGFLLYLPAYQWVDGERLFVGWIYSPLRADDLFGAITDEPLWDGVVVAVYDGAPVEANRLHRSAAVPVSDQAIERTLEIGGIPLTIRLSPLPGVTGASAARHAWQTFALGLLLTLLLAALSFQQQRGRLRVERLVEKRTRDLKAANEELINEAAARSEAETQMRHLQKMEAVGQLSGGIAHDFNNMLAIITGNLDMAKRTEDPERRARALDRALLGSHKAAELTQRLLAFSRRQTLMPETVDCNRLVAEMSELLRRTLGEQIELETALAPDLWPVTVDPSQLENAIVNLAVNARDAMSGGGRLTITTSNRELGRGDRGATGGSPEGQFVLIAIADTGVGMSAEVQSKAVEPFFTTKEVGKGTGLGLSQVFGFLKQSGGHFDIASTEGVGTTIMLYLPRALEEAATASTPRPPASEDLPQARPGETVLVVEDEAAVREMSRNAFEALGYAVLEAADGKEALGVLDDHAGRIDLVFTDVVMPRMDGRRLADAMAQRHPGVPILFTTGFTPDGIVHDQRLDSDVTLLPKPFSLARLAVAVRERIDRD